MVKNNMKAKIKEKSVDNVAQSLDPEVLAGELKIHNLLLLYSKTLKEIENNQIDNIIINNISDLEEQPTAVCYYHNQNMKRSEITVDKIEIITKSNNQVEALIKTLKTASKYVKDNKNKYEFVGDMTIKSRITTDGECATLNMYLYNYN